MASEVGVLDIPETQDRQEVAAAAGQDAARRPRAGPHRRRRRAEAHARHREALSRVDREVPAVASRTMPEPAPPRRPRCRCSTASRRSATRRKTSRSSSRRWRESGEEAIGSMGNDAALPVLSEPAEGLLQLLQAAVRAGHEPADRPDPRGARDVARVVHRAAAEPARGRRPTRAPSRRCASRCSSRS